MEKEKVNLSASNREQAKKGQGHTSKSSIVVALRNKFFYMMYRNASLVFVTSLITMISSVMVFMFFTNQKVPAQYVPINEDGTYINLLPIRDCKSKSEAEVKRFITRATNKLFRYDYINYADQFQDFTQFFTPEGWNEYLTSFKNSGSLNAVLENKWIVTNEILGIAEFTKEPYLDPEDNACTWEAKIPLVVTYVGSNSQKSRVDFYVRLSRVSVIKSPEGLGIKRVVTKTVGQ